MALQAAQLPVVDMLPAVPGLPAVWLAPDASLTQKCRLPAREGEPLVVQTVGVTDCSHCAEGVLLMLN